jgi:integrase
VATESEQRLLLTFLHTAGRRNEIFSLKKDDVDFENGRIRLWTRKRMGGLEADWLPMTEELEEVLREQRLETPFHEHFFVNPETGLPWTEHGRLLPRLCKKAGIEPFGYHSIRHLSASILDDKGFPLSTIQAILRHKSSHTTARYLHSLRGAKVEIGEAFRRERKESRVVSLQEKR